MACSVRAHGRACSRRLVWSGRTDFWTFGKVKDILPKNVRSVLRKPSNRKWRRNKKSRKRKNTGWVCNLPFNSNAKAPSRSGGLPKCEGAFGNLLRKSEDFAALPNAAGIHAGLLL